MLKTMGVANKKNKCIRVLKFQLLILDKCVDHKIKFCHE